MSFPYEGPQNELRLRVRPPTQSLPSMPDIPMKAAKPVVRGLRTTPKATWAERKATADQKVKQAQKSVVRKQFTSQGGADYKESQHPRDRFGRFAVKAVKATGRAIGRTARVTGKAIKGTAKAVKSAHKTVKRINADMRRRDALAHRERLLKLHKREQAAGMKRKKVVRRRKR